MLIYLETHVKAAQQVCFDLARSIDLHQHTMQHTAERAVAGVTSGLIGLGETVTWQAKHFGVIMCLSTRITAFKQPSHFTDEQIKGPFKRLHHQHKFIPTTCGTLMVDEFIFESPLGLLGRLVDKFILKQYLTNLLKHRNHIIKMTAEQTTA